MTTLKERFFAGDDFTKEGVLAFFRRELLALAEEVEGKKRISVLYNEVKDDLDIAMQHTELVHNQALDTASAIIRQSITK